METIIAIIEFVNTFIEAINIILSAIQWFFTALITIIGAFYTIWSFITGGLDLLYQFATMVPVWLWAIPLAWISYRLIVFVKSFGGD